ncbi:hypothetical protein FKP32DRAFT_1744813 [Trametes sanguinea]|nr:hypothetical protein FKP32DRAFT_1744813 [Trametes sanguinea]
MANRTDTTLAIVYYTLLSSHTSLAHRASTRRVHMDESDHPSGAETFVRQMPLAHDTWKSSLGPWRLVGDGMIHDQPTNQPCTCTATAHNPQPTAPGYPYEPTNHLAPTPRNREEDAEEGAQLTSDNEEPEYRAANSMENAHASDGVSYQDNADD